MTSYRLSPDAACAVVEDGAVVLHMRTKRYFSLNETGAAIWRMLEDDLPLPDIPSRLVVLYEVDAETAEGATTGLLEELASEELITLTVNE
jgi:hypothetical protein